MCYKYGIEVMSRHRASLALYLRNNEISFSESLDGDFMFKTNKDRELAIKWVERLKKVGL